jgi:hypothetical protein
MKNFLNKAFVLSPVLAILIAVPSFFWTIYSLLLGDPTSLLTYLSYVLSAYGLTVLTVAVVRIVRAWKKDPKQLKLVKAFRESKFGSAYLRDPMFRTRVALWCGLMIGVAYAAFHLLAGLWQHSVWFGALSGYYLLLSLMRFLLLYRKREARMAQYRLYRFCGILLLLMNQVLAVLVIQIVRAQRGKEYPGILIYVMAVYSFYAIILAIYQMVKYRNYGNPVLYSAKAISLTGAMVSILSLETAMLSAFGSADQVRFRTVMTALTGGAVCIIVLAMAILMIIDATRKMKSISDPERKSYESKK